VEPAGAIGGVACIPLYSGVRPLACVILVLAPPDVLMPEPAAELERALIELGRTVEAARRPGIRVGLADDAQRALVDGALAGFPDELRHVRDEAERLRLAEQALRAEREQLEQALADAQAIILQTEDARAGALAEMESLHGALASAQAKILEAEEEHQRASAEVERVKTLGQRAASPGAVAGAGHATTSARAAPPAAASGARRLIAVLDTDAAWETSGVAEVVVVPPGPDVASRLDALAPGLVLLNLAAPDAYAQLIALRALGSPQRWWGCLAAANVPRTLLLGMIEPAGRPLDPEAVLAQLRHHPSARRVLAAGSDGATFLSLRQTLTRAGMSVSTAWDAKQAADLLPMVRADALIVDLGLQPRGGYGLVAAVAAASPPVVTVLMPGEDDVAAGFAAALAQHANGAGALSRSRLLDEIRRRTVDRPTAVPLELRK
jgi:hypothetical protein